RGSEGALISGRPVMGNAPMGGPWLAMFRLRGLYRTGCPVALEECLASFQADSTASEPLVVKNTRFRSPGARLASRWASSTALGCAYDHSGKYASSEACRAPASAISWRP